MHRRTVYSLMSIGVLTSGGDAQGMNAAVRAVVRMALYLGCKVFFIKEGYEGMLEGGDNIVEASWTSVSNILHVGGTIIGSARCKGFRERTGRLRAAENLVKCGITNLVVIGGDGSLTGANLFRSEWKGLLDELLKAKRLTPEEVEIHSDLRIAGMVGSIDNDFCGTDMTIGTDTALHRITEAIDAIVSTAYSHQRTFILEVMGRRCGYLALAAAMSCEADYLFIPEDPENLDWPQTLCKKLEVQRATGERLSVIILAEGATDIEGNPITSEMVKKVVGDDLKHDVRVTVLGHVQRGGDPSAFDQLLGCRLGAQAVLTLVDSAEEDEACVIIQEGNRIQAVPLMPAVMKTLEVAKALNEKRYKDVIELRGKSFGRNLNIYKLLGQTSWENLEIDASDRLTFAVMHVGAPACGMNAAVHSFVRSLIHNGHMVYGIYDGFDGFFKGKIKKLEWITVTGWVLQGSANLRTTDTLPEGKFDKIAEQMRKFKIQGLLAVGGFEAYHAFGQLVDQRKNFREFCVPLCVIPATISNNIPGTEISLGADTSLNEIINACNSLRLAGAGTQRAFIVEVMGGYCGYLAIIGGLAAGADSTYIFEEKFTIRDIQRDCDNMIQKMEDGVQRGLILRNENANENYSTDFIRRIFAEEGKGKFTTRANIFGHWQLGGRPSPFDRTLGCKMGSQTAEWMLDQAKKGISNDYQSGVYTAEDDSACILCLQRRNYKFVSMKSLIDVTDFEHRVPTNQWWLSVKPLVKILALHHSAYKKEGADRPLKSFIQRREMLNFQ